MDLLHLVGEMDLAGAVDFLLEKRHNIFTALCLVLATRKSAVVLLHDHVLCQVA